MNYEKRLMRVLSDGVYWFTITDYAAMWKRSKLDVEQAAINLKMKRKIKIGKDGVLSMREGIGYA